MFAVQILGLDIYGCKETLERLNVYLDRDLAPDEEGKVERHLRACLECASKFRFEEELLREIRDRVQKVRVPGDLELLQSKIAALLAQERDRETE